MTLLLVLTTLRIYFQQVPIRQVRLDLPRPRYHCERHQMVIDDSRKQVLKRFHGSMEDNNNIMKEVSLTSRSTSPPSHDIIILFMLCRGGCSNSQPNTIFVYCKRDIFPNLPLTRAHVNRLRSLLMAISFHLQSLLENHQSHLPPKGAKVGGSQ